MAFTPLAVIQPILGHIASHVARERPEVYARLGVHVRKRFLIDPIDLPFVLILQPEVSRPDLRAYRRSPPMTPRSQANFLIFST